MTPEGIVSVLSSFSHVQTVDRLVAAIAHAGMRIFCRLDHTQAAAAAGLALRPTCVVLFGSPAAGTPLMKAAPLVALDLPLRVQVWDDADGLTWLSRCEPGWIAHRHALPEASHAAITAMTAALGAIVRYTAQTPAA